MDFKSASAGLKTAIVSVIFWILFFAFVIVAWIAVMLFSIIYVLAIIGPWLTGRFEIRNRFRNVIDWVFGIDEIHLFRDDIQELVGKHRSVSSDDRPPSQVKRDIIQLQEEEKAKAERGEFFIAIIAGMISVVAGFLTGISNVAWLVGVYSTLMGLTIGLHVTILDILAYSRDDDLTPNRDPHLRYKEGWNIAILSNRQIQASVLLVGILYRISPTGYEIAKDLLDEVLEQEMDRFEAVFFLSYAIQEIAHHVIKKKV